MTLTINSATGGPYEWLGRLIREAGLEDASGSRRHYTMLLKKNRTAELAAILKVPESEVIALRNRIIEVWGEPK